VKANTEKLLFFPQKQAIPGMSEKKATGMNQSKLWKQIPQQAAVYYTLRFAG
jgi:hypothetical protein